MGDAFSDGDKQWRREQAQKARTQQSIANRTRLLIGHLGGKSDFDPFLEAYRRAGMLQDLPYEADRNLLLDACAALKKRKRVVWASLLFRMHRHPDQYAALKEMSPFARQTVVAMELVHGASAKSVVIRGFPADVDQAHALLDAGQARFRSIDGSGYYTVTKAKRAL